MLMYYFPNTCKKKFLITP